MWLIETLNVFKEVDLEVADRYLKVAHNHLHYLSPEFCFLPLCSNTLPKEDKGKLAQNSLQFSPPLDENGKLCFQVQSPKPEVPITKDTQVSDLAESLPPFPSL